ncbi:DUF2914 domain-containing protein [Pseudocolwellia sp. HL-MZ7]|uniref:DUF2914 domain-containing protein n=1 Tax=Pseudocolwellia sp. HL-MZ7 TaxID=3400627 RepID=UPI003CE908EA
MELKIQFNVSKDPISSPEPAPFDPVKIRNFLLLIVTLLSLIGFGVYSLWTTESEPSLPDTLNSPSIALSSAAFPKHSVSNNSETDTSTSYTSASNIAVSNIAVSNIVNAQPAANISTNTETQANTETLVSSALAEDTTTNIVDSTVTNNTVSNTENHAASDAVHTKVPQNKVASNEVTAQAKTANTTPETNIPETSTTEASTTKATLAITSDSPAQKIARVEPELATKKEQEPKLKSEAQNTINVTPAIVNKVEQKSTDLLTSNKTLNKIVQRAQLTSNILSREPSDNIEHLSLQEKNKLYLFTEIHDKNNQKIYHRWVFKKNLIAEITLNIRNDPWRTYSSKNFDETMIGQWEVQVVDQDDNILKTIMFDVSR